MQQQQMLHQMMMQQYYGGGMGLAPQMGHPSPLPTSSSNDNIYFLLAIIVGVVFMGIQVMDSVKNTQEKKFKKLRKEMDSQLTEDAKREEQPHFGLEDELSSSSDIDVIKQFALQTKKKPAPSRNKFMKRVESCKDFDSQQTLTENQSDAKYHQDLNHQQLTNLINEKLSSAQNSTVKEPKQQNIDKEMRKLVAEKEVLRQSSYISRGSMHSARMKDSTLNHAKALSNSKHPIIRICLTGGPCAGKTTALATLTQVLTQLGFRVLLVPEAATMLMKGGAMIQTHKLSLHDAVKFQINVMRAQMAFEDIFIDIALNCDQKCVIICDRGVMDGSAYTDSNVWQALLDETAWNTI